MTAYATEVLTDAPLLYWRLGEASGTVAADASGNGNAGTYVGAPTLGTTGLLTGDVNTAATLADATDQHVESAAWGSLVLTAFTLECIVNLSDLRESYGYEFLCGFFESGIDIELNLSNFGVGDNEFSFFWQGSSSHSSVAYSMPASTGTRYHLAVVYDGTDTRLYLNGALVYTHSAGAGDSKAITGKKFYAGNDSFGIGDGMDGVLDEVAFYSHALAAGRVTAHYNAMLGGGGGSAPNFTADSPPATGVSGTPYTYTFMATGSPAPTFSVSSGVPPLGVTLNPTTGVLSGTPSTIDTFTFRITASNGVSPDAVSPLLTITISSGGGGPSPPVGNSYVPVTVSLNSFAFDDVTESPTGVQWCWQDLSGWFDTADQRVDQHEVDIGVTVTVDRRNGRPITLTVLAHSPHGWKLDDLLYSAQRALKAAVRPSVDVPVLLKVNEPSIPLQSYVRQAGPIRTKVLGTRYMVQFQIPLLAPDPRRYAQTATTPSLTSGTTTVTNAGDMSSPGVFTITGTTPNPQIRNLTLDQDPQVIYGGTLGGGDTLVIDVAQQTVLLNGVDARANLTVAHWWEFAPGNNSIQVNNNTAISFRAAYS